MNAGVHQIIAEQFGIDEAALTGLLTDLSTAAVDNRIRPPLSYLGKLTRDPNKVSPSTHERSSPRGGTSVPCTTRCQSAPCSTHEPVRGVSQG